MTGSFLTNINPTFQSWYAAQDPAVQSHIQTYWAKTAHDPEVVPVAGGVSYYRQSLLLGYCATAHGYVIR